MNMGKRENFGWISILKYCLRMAKTYAVGVTEAFRVEARMILLISIPLLEGIRLGY